MMKNFIIFVVLVLSIIYLTDQAVTKDPCFPNPCKNEECRARGSSYRCNCTKRYSGRNCDIVSPNCTNCKTRSCIKKSKPCQCKLESSAMYLNTFKCSDCKCKDICANNPCVNGICSKTKNGFSCLCPADVGGSLCEFTWTPFLSGALPAK